MLGDFTVKKCKIGKGNLYLKKINKVETKCGVLQIITVINVECAKGLLDLNFD